VLSILEQEYRAMIHIEHEGSVAIAKLERGPTNALNLELIQALSETLQQVRLDPEVRGLVLCGNEKFFSIGFDIPQLFPLDREGFRTFYQAFNRACIDLYTLPKPTMAAITGHAIAGGSILALCCDYRFIAEGRKLMGLNEIKLGVPIPYPGDCVLRQLVGTRIAREMTEIGDFYQSEVLLRMGVVDDVLPAEHVLSRAVERAESHGAYPQRAFAMIKRDRVEMVEEQIRTGLDEREAHFIDCWFSDEARGRLKAAMERF
jgi:enoyl-CoA hydratase/carnithine racemase